MPFRTITAEDGRTWRVQPSGFTTANYADEVGVLFVHGTGEGREVRVTRFSPVGARARDQAIAELSDDKLRQLLRESQPSATAPEAGYRRSPPGAALT
jgi:hypothetical protein